MKSNMDEVQVTIRD